MHYRELRVQKKREQYCHVTVGLLSRTRSQFFVTSPRSKTCFFREIMPLPKFQYKWVAKYPNGRKEFSHWMEPRSDCIQDFIEYMDNQTLLENSADRGTLPYRTLMPGEEEISEPVYYLDTRIKLDQPFCIIPLRLKSFKLFRWKIKCRWSVFSRANDPSWTLHKGPWIGDFYECLKECNQICPLDCEEIIEGCETEGYVYLRQLFPNLD